MKKITGVNFINVFQHLCYFEFLRSISNKIICRKVTYRFDITITQRVIISHADTFRNIDLSSISQAIKGWIKIRVWSILYLIVRCITIPLLNRFRLDDTVAVAVRKCCASKSDTAHIPRSWAATRSLFYPFTVIRLGHFMVTSVNYVQYDHLD